MELEGGKWPDEAIWGWKITKEKGEVTEEGCRQKLRKRGSCRSYCPPVRNAYFIVKNCQLFIVAVVEVGSCDLDRGLLSLDQTPSLIERDAFPSYPAYLVC